MPVIVRLVMFLIFMLLLMSLGFYVAGVYDIR